ncbi:hypothetical protein E2562_021800 [Oryza meyeriana var. granulata]|uniref:Uncharacterized protein n=1 Tax=Oryza meyeriana var. granulata TaxID=110450 RepID=A0A6G1EN86_9ORYZ|nr:hypothetical protein E2562_021800 [Oryza meyeriana var. granulata]
MAKCFPFAARRLSGDLVLFNMVPKKDATDEVEEGGAILELPCFGSATKLLLDLGFLAAAMPRSGVFARLTDLSLDSVRFHGPCELGDAVSSRRSPSLEKLTVRNAQGLSNLIIHSESLLLIQLERLKAQALFGNCGWIHTGRSIQGGIGLIPASSPWLDHSGGFVGQSGLVGI